MRNAQFFHVLESRDELLEIGAWLLFREMSVLDNMFKQFSLFEVFGDDEEVALGFDDLIADPCTS